MADLATLKVRVDATEAVNATKRLGTELKTVDREAKSVTSTMRGLRGAFSAVAGSMVVREFVRFADTARLLEGRLKLVTASAEELRQVQDDLFASAQRTRSDYESSVTLYARVARATRDLGLAQSELLKFTELTQMAIKTSGATSTEAAAALVQLSQGLAAGTLRGEEFNSVMEQTPGLALAIAQGLGVGVGELRKLAQQGQLTAKEVINAVLSMDTAIRRDFATAPQTVSDAWTVTKNNVLQAIAEIDRQFNASRAFATLLRFTGEVVADVTRPGGGGGTRLADLTPEQRAFQQWAATPEGREFIAANERRQREAEYAAGAGERERAAVAAMRDYADELVKLSSLTRLSATDMQVLRNADASYTNALRDGNLAVADRIKLLERQAGIQGVLGAAQTQALQSRATADLERLRGSLGAGRVTRVGGNINAGAVGLPAEQANKMQQYLDAARIKSMQVEFAERDRVQQQLANNFRENMQRAFGDVLTEFVTRGKVSIANVFDSLKQMGGSMIGQQVSKMITGALPAAMGPLGFLAAGAGLLGLGSLFGRRRAPRESESERIAREQARFAANEDAKRARDREMAEFMAGRNGGRGGVIQSVGQVLQETSASRMIGELVAIRIATTRTADAVAGGQFAGGPATINVTVQGGLAGNMQAVGEQVAEAVDRLLGTRVQTLRLSSGQAVTA